MRNRQASSYLLTIVATATLGVLALTPCLGFQTQTPTRSWEATQDAGTRALLEHRLDAAERLFNEAITQARAFGVNDARSTASYHGLAEVLYGQGRYDDAQGVFRRVLEFREAVQGPDHPDVANALQILAVVETTQGRLDNARMRLERALGIDRKRFGSEHPKVGAVLRDMGWVQILSARFDDAYNTIRRARENLVRSRPANDPDFVECQFQFFLIETLVRLDHAKNMSAREIDEASRQVPGMISILERNYRPDDPRIAMMDLLLGRLDQTRARQSDARASFLKGLAGLESRLGPQHLFVIYLLERLCETDLRLSLAEEAEKLGRRVLGIHEAATKPDPLKIAACLDFLVMAARMQGKLSEAESEARRSLGLRENALGKDHEGVVTSLSNLGQVLKEQGRLSESESVLRRGLVILENRGKPEDRELGVSLLLLASIYREKGDPSQAVPLYQRSLLIFERLSGADDPFTLSVLDELCDTYIQQHRYDLAETAYSRALRVFQQRRGFNVPEVARLRARLAHVMHLEGNDPRAGEFYRLAMPLEKLSQAVGREQAARWLEEYASILRSHHQPGEADSVELRAHSMRSTIKPAPR